MSFRDCLVEGAGPWERLRVASKVMKILQERPVLRLLGLPELWEEARMVHHSAMKEIFGPKHAQVAALYAPAFVSPFASPASLSPATPAPQSPAAPVSASEGAQPSSPLPDSAPEGAQGGSTLPAPALEGAQQRSPPPDPATVWRVGFKSSVVGRLAASQILGVVVCHREETNFILET